VDLVFRALADPHRRSLLDALFADDGRTLTQLCTVLPELTRFGVMKHLGVLTEAHLVTTHKVGREKHHYLNPVPIREIHDRWISKFAATAILSGTLSAMVDLKRSLEGNEPWPTPDTSSRPTSARRPSRSGRR
jgi:DNA-binding transcriptional ArsR family regulator